MQGADLLCAGMYLCLDKEQSCQNLDVNEGGDIEIQN